MEAASKAIDDKHAAYAGILGNPLGSINYDIFVGFYRLYERGGVYWLPGVGAHEVHGLIFEKYKVLNPWCAKDDVLDKVIEWYGSWSNAIVCSKSEKFCIGNECGFYCTATAKYDVGWAGGAGGQRIWHDWARNKIMPF